MTVIVRGTLRDFWSRRSTLLVLMMLEAVGVSALSVAGMMTHAVLVNPVPFPKAHAVVQVWNAQPERGVTHLYLNRGESEFFREQSRLEQMGWIKASWRVSDNDRRARFYTITPRGRKQVQAEAANRERAQEIVARFLNAAPDAV